MWFKNLTIFRISEPLPFTAETLAAKLEQHAFQPCPSFQAASVGWTPPLGRKATDLLHTVAGCWLICLRTEEKVLPPVVVNQIVAERVTMLEEQRQYPVRRRERQELREQIVQELLPRALSRNRDSFAYVDTDNKWLVVDSASSRGVEELTSALRDALGTLAITPLQTQKPPVAVMTAWLAEGHASTGFTLGDVCELHEMKEGSGVVRCRGQDLNNDELRGHLEVGKQVVRLGLVWDERVAFILDESLVIRRLRFLDVVRESLQDMDADSAEAIFDAEFALMTGELSQLLPRLLGILGGDT